VADYKNFDTYISQDHHSDVKESFRQLAKIISSTKGRSGNLKVLDVGCATGALIGFLKSVYPHWDYTGVDISKELLAIANNKVSNCNWVSGSALELPKTFDNKFDLIVCFGVLGIFDEKDAVDMFDCILKAAKPGARIVVFSQFNEMDVDTQITHRKYTGEGESRGWEKGWNNYSFKTIRAWLKGRVSSEKFINFQIPIMLERQEDLVRSWTIEFGSRKQLTNGLKLLIDLKFLDIVK